MLISYLGFESDVVAFEIPFKGVRRVKLVGFGTSKTSLTYAVGCCLGAH